MPVGRDILSWFTGAKPAKARPGRAKISSQRRVFHGVAIKPPDDDACAAAVKLMGERFLADEAPRLPLSDCTHPAACHCVYQHFDDRRTEARRESDIGLPMRDIIENKRDGIGRRITDS